eukprot:TRINITY_DN1425_c0_g1_i1.p1 TRINITY_DN1425_c0_g1~~TRINITY_DN1425_c0_g1_i1.p1  ORF type:complete len:347 (+),score=63.51 TRINITY_DN1425_c0_g1_i1:81-1121(+)
MQPVDMETADESEQPWLVPPHSNSRTKSATWKLTGSVLAICACGILAVHTIFTKAPESTHTQAFSQAFEKSGCFMSHGRNSCCKHDKADRTFHGGGHASILDGLSEADCACQCAKAEDCKAYEFNHHYWRCELHMKDITNFTCGSAAGPLKDPHHFECSVKQADTCDPDDVCPVDTHEDGKLWGEETEKASCKQYRVEQAPEPKYQRSCKGEWKKGGRTGVNGGLAAFYYGKFYDKLSQLVNPRKKIQMKLARLKKALPLACSDCPTWDCSGAYIGDRCWTQAGLAGAANGHWICCPGNFGENGGALFENFHGSCMTWQPGDSLDDCPPLNGSDCGDHCVLGGGGR